MKNILGQELTDFYFLAHSFGGFLTSNYVVKHWKHIRKLFLLSPVGMKHTKTAISGLDAFTEKQCSEKTEKESAGFADFPKPIAVMLNFVWMKGISPQTTCQFIGKKFFK